MHEFANSGLEDRPAPPDRRRRLAEAAAQLNLAGVTIGHAVFSPQCHTAEALVSQAVKDAEPVVTR